VKLLHLVGFIIKKFVMMHDHINVKFTDCVFCFTLVVILNFSPNISRVTKSRRLKLEEHLEPLREKCIQEFDRETLRMEIT